MSSNIGQKIKYNGKEYQNELSLNWFDYGARNYDPAIGRWMNIDPLAEVYPNVSPYNYTSNNPVFFVDYDGRDYGIFIDHNKRTITYKANYYFNNGKDLAANLDALADWMKLEGEYTTKDGVEYSISIELNAKIAGEGEDAETLAENDNIGNSIIELDAAAFEAKFIANQGKNYGDDIMGFTIDKKNIYNRKSEPSSKVRSHEIGHTLGEDDYAGQTGVMAYKEHVSLMSKVTAQNGERVMKRDYRTHKHKNLNTPHDDYGTLTTIHVIGTYSIGNFMDRKKFKLRKND